MTTTLKHQLEFETIFLLLIAAGVGFLFLYKNNPQKNFKLATDLPVMQAQAEIVSSKITTTSQISPDGIKKVLMIATENSDQTTAYEIYTINEDGSNKKHIFTKTLNFPKNMSIPYNTWSPDDKYFFVQENDGNNNVVYVYKEDGGYFGDDEKFINLTELFTDKETGYNYDLVTGWASETLLIANTKDNNGTKGPSYWVEIPSKVIIQLSTEF